MPNILPTQAFEGQEVRVVGTSDGLWFSASDVCGCLGLHAGAVDTLDDWMIGSFRFRDLPSESYVVLVNEAGLSSLAFQCSSPVFKRFQRWVFDCLLPQSRELRSQFGVADLLRLSGVRLVRGQLEFCDPHNARLHRDRAGVDYVAIASVKVAALQLERAALVASGGIPGQLSRFPGGSARCWFFPPAKCLEVLSKNLLAAA
jgi:hypothetical protein